MPSYTIITTDGALSVQGARWTRSPDDDVYVYPDDDHADPVAEVDDDEFVAIFDPDCGDFARASDD